jgi:DUF1009 family protein
VRALGPYDVGQAVVVSRGRVEAVEGVEGTDAMLARVAQQRRSRVDTSPARLGVLVKRPKPGQELRIDLPAIGPDTVRRAANARLAGIAVLALGTLAAERTELVRCADAADLFVQGFDDKSPAAATRRVALERTLEIRGKRAPGRRQRADALEGAAVLAALAPYCPSRGAIVDGGHVLAVESGEGAIALVARAAGLRQWGHRPWMRRTGVVVLSDASELEAAVLAAADAGLAGVAVVGQHPAALARAVLAADRIGLWLAAVTPAARTPKGSS